MKKNRLLSNNKGITLIALVITIIVLLILAGITLNLLQQNNLISTAEQTKHIWNSEAKKENEQMKKLLDKLEIVEPLQVTISKELPEKWNPNTVIAVANTRKQKSSNS